MVNLAFQGFSVTKAPGDADLYAFPTAARYSHQDIHTFEFTVKSRQAKIGFIAGKQGLPIFENNYYNLSLHIPPSEISYTHNKEVTRNKVRVGWLIEKWGDSLISIEASGQTGAFFKGGEGLTRVDAYKTHAYAELMELFQIYKNNGMSYNPEDGTIDTISEVILTYAGQNFRGSFDAFTYSESADKPFAFNYSFVFVARGEKAQDVVVSGHYVDLPPRTILEANETNSYLASIGFQSAQEYIVSLQDQAEYLLSDIYGKTVDDDTINRQITKLDANVNDVIYDSQKTINNALPTNNKVNKLNSAGAALTGVATNKLEIKQRELNNLKSPTKPKTNLQDRTKPVSRLPAGRQDTIGSQAPGVI